VKTIFFVLALLVAVAQQPPPMPPPGNPWHAEPLPGAFCAHGPTVPEGQACACEPKCMEGHDEEGNPDGTIWRIEDNLKCRAACHPKHCNCVSNCEP